MAPPLAKPAMPPLALALDGVADERDDVGQFNLAFERGGDRSDLHFDDGRETVVAGLLQRLATGDCGLEHFGVVEQFPDFWSIGGQSHLACHRHGHERVPPRQTRPMSRMFEISRSIGTISQHAMNIKIPSLSHPYNGDAAFPTGLLFQATTLMASRYILMDTTEGAAFGSSLTAKRYRGTAPGSGCRALL